MILNKGPPSEFETSNKISNSGGTDMYIEHPYFYEGKYYVQIPAHLTTHSAKSRSVFPDITERVSASADQ